MCSAFFRGTNIDQDVKFRDQEKKMMKSRKWPECYSQKIDLQKVQIDIIKIWTERKIIELMGEEDEIVINFAITQIEDAQANNEELDPRKMEINLTGFLEQNTPKFVQELWNLMLSAQKTVTGIPRELIQEKQGEKQRKIEQIQKIKQKLAKIQQFTAQPQKYGESDAASQEYFCSKPENTKLISKNERDSRRRSFSNSSERYERPPHRDDRKTRRRSRSDSRERRRSRYSPERRSRRPRYSRSRSKSDERDSRRHHREYRHSSKRH